MDKHRLPDTGSDGKTLKALDGDESLGYLFRAAHRAFVTKLAQELEPDGISPGQWSLFRVLWHEENLTQVELAERMGVEKASLTGVLTSLERKGFVKRLRNRKDRRKINVHLTEKGRALEAKLLPFTLVNVNRAAARDISERDIAHCRAVIERMIDNLREASGVAVSRTNPSPRRAGERARR